MAYNYLIPTVGTLPLGYDCTIDPPYAKVGALLDGGSARVLWRTRIMHDGEEKDSIETELVFENGQIQGSPPAPRVWQAANTRWSSEPGFFENDYVVADGSPRFVSNLQPSAYVIYSAPDRKSFFSDQAYRYASPPVIDQIAAYGSFVDSYPPVHVDRERDFGETIVMINPYSRDIVATVLTSDDRRLKRVRVPPMSARNVRLDQLLEPDETAWRGRIQISATNRVITYDIKHSLANPEIISDHEHLDPYRADPTHLPAFQWFRQAVGKFLEHRGVHIGGQP